MPTGCASRAFSRSPGHRPRAVRSSIRRPSSSGRTSRADWATSVEYTFARSRDNSPSISGGGGGGGTGNVAQDDQNIDAEWARSSFEQRHRLTLSAQLSLPIRAATSGGSITAACGPASPAAGVSARTSQRQLGTAADSHGERCGAGYRERHQRRAARGLQRRAGGDRESVDRSVVQHRRLHGTRGRRVRVVAAQHHHRPRLEEPEHELQPPGPTGWEPQSSDSDAASTTS